MRSFVLAPLLAALVACGSPDEGEVDCLVRITDVTVTGDTMTATGTFVTAQARLVFSGTDNNSIPGVAQGDDRVTFDLSSLLPGPYNYSFEARCFDDRDTPTLDAPTGNFTRP